MKLIILTLMESGNEYPTDAVPGIICSKRRFPI